MMIAWGFSQAAVTSRDASISRGLLRRTINQQMSQPINQSFTQISNQHYEQSINNTNNQSMNQSINFSAGQSISHSPNPSFNTMWATLSLLHPFQRQSSKQCIINQPTFRSMTLCISQSIEHPDSQTIAWPTICSNNYLSTPEFHPYQTPPSIL